MSPWHAAVFLQNGTFVNYGIYAGFSAFLLYTLINLRKLKTMSRRATKPFWASRMKKIREYNKLAKQITDDAQALLQLKGSRQYEARVLIPLVASAREKGEKLFDSQKFLHTFLTPSLEENLQLSVNNLVIVEKSLRALPKSLMTLEQVLAGEFNLSEHSDTEILAEQVIL